MYSRAKYQRAQYARAPEILEPPLDVKLMNSVSNLLVAGLVVLLGVGGLWTLIRNPIFALNQIYVAGDVQHNNEVTLRANVAPQLLGNFFTLDLLKAKLAFESVPWVRKAVVERRFPNELLVQLEEHRAVAFWGSEAESRLVNSAGEVFTANTGDLDVENLPRLQGPDDESALVLSMYKALAPEFEKLKSSLKGLELSGRGSWRATLDSGVEIELGRGSVSEVQNKVQRFVKTLAHVLARLEKPANALESADLRHENGYALRLRGLRTLESATRK